MLPVMHSQATLRPLITHAITTVRNRLMEKHNIPVPGLSDGWCETIATDALHELRLPSCATEADEPFEVDPYSFLIPDELFPVIIDTDLIARHWPNVKPPPGLTFSDIDALAIMSGHFWITDGLLHYDSESPAGEKNFFDLKYFRNNIVAAVIHDKPDWLPQLLLNHQWWRDSLIHHDSVRAWISQHRASESPDTPATEH